MRYSIVVILVFIVTCFGQPKLVSGDDIVKAVKKYYFDAESFKAKFITESYHSLSPSDKKSYEGSLYVKGQDFELKTPSLEWVFKDCILWKYSKEHEQVVISNEDCNQNTLNPLSILNKILDWKVERVLKYTQHRKDPQYKINFIPNDDFYSQASLFVSVKFVPRKIILKDIAQNTTTYTLKNIQRNFSKEIKFEARSDVEIIDLRE